MNAFKRKALATAVFAGLGIGSAHAVYQDPHGLGQALIYPYYTVQSVDGNAFNTYVSVVNTTTTGKVVKVRVREGKNSREVLDFNLYLSPNDVWVGVIQPESAAAGAPGLLTAPDNSCTNPAIPAAGVSFRNFAYVDDPSTTAVNEADGAGIGLDRTREGYIEMLEMATVTGASLAAITHGTTGMPANCAAVRGAGPNALPAANRAAPTGGLFGAGTLINVANGSDSTYNAIALANVTTTDIYTDIGTEQGNLAQADGVSVVVTSASDGTRVYTSGWTLGIDAVSATMMNANVINEYVLDQGTKSNTDWVVTFPTKRFYVDTTSARAPFTNKFTATGSCETISFAYWNREERSAQATGGDFSPLPPGSPASSLCWESTVVSIRAPGAGMGHIPTGTTSGVLGSVNTTPIMLQPEFTGSGWARMTFASANAIAGITAAAGSTTNVTTGLSSAVAQTYRGLPVVGFMTRSFNNGTLVCAGAACQGNYGSANAHSYTQNITPAP